MKTLATVLLLALLAPLAHSPGAQAMLEANGCLGCHAIDKRVVGPAFAEVAAKYRGDKAAEATLYGELKAGKGHPIAVQAPENDLRTMIRFVLASAKPAAVKP